jgi:hypothetical protein
MKKLFLFLCLMLFNFFLFAQKYYAVKVADSKTEYPLKRATVKNKLTNNTDTTGENGTTVIQASPGEVLYVSCKGYTSQEVTISAQAAVHVFLEKKKIKKRKNRY